MKLGLFILSTATLALGGCATPIKKDMSAFTAAAPRSILVVPAVNKSLDVDAPNYLLSTLTIPLAEKGYYVFPVNTAKIVLEQEGYYEGEQVHRQSVEVLAKLFGADAVLFVTINRWDAKYILLSTVVTVDFAYRIVAKDGTEIWSATQTMQYSPQASNSGNPIADLIAAAINAAITRAAPNYLPLARQANQQVFVMGPNAIPNGPYWHAAGAKAKSVGSGNVASGAGGASPAASIASPMAATLPIVASQPAEAASATRQVPSQTLASPAPAHTAVTPLTQQQTSALALRGGQDSFQAQQLAKDRSCSSNPTAVLVAKGPGLESYTVTCMDGSMMSIQCSFGNCAVVH